MSKIRHLLGISGGKDSAALAIYMKQKYPTLEIEYYTCDTGKELDETYELIKNQFELMGHKLQIYDFKTKIGVTQEMIYNEMESLNEFNFLVCDSNNYHWAQQCVNYCDLVILAIDFNAPSDTYEIEEKLNLYSNNILNEKIYLLLLYNEDTSIPNNTQRWFNHRNIDLHFHMRKNNLNDIRRFCRTICHQAIGLVLGGGGAKGYAHVGAVKALIEAGIEIDFVGGTSAGAMYGVGLSYSDFNIDKMIHFCQFGAESKVTNADYTIPLISIMSGRKMQKFLKQVLGLTFLEDLWINTFCVSTNYSKATLCIHEKGLAWQQIEASIAVPGIFPPVIIDHHLHVDGGVMDNLPIETMNNKPVKYIIAISLSPDINHSLQFEKMPSTWELIWNKITSKKHYNLPNLPSIIVNSMTLNSRQKQDTTKSFVSLFLELDLKKFGFIHENKYQNVIQAGYSQTQKYINNIPIQNRFWIQNK